MELTKFISSEYTFNLVCPKKKTWEIAKVYRVLLCISIGFALYALYTESRTLRQIQRELLALLRDTPTSDLQAFFDDEHNLHQD